MQTTLILTLCLTLWSVSCTKSTKDSEAIPAVTEEQTLSKLIVISDQIEPAFDPFVNQYTLAGGPSYKNRISINTAPKSSKYQIMINGVKLRSDFTTDPMALTAGANAFVITLVDSAGKTVNSYRLDVTRVQDLPDEELNDLAFSDGQQVPDFAPDTTAYQLTVGKDTSVLTVSPLVSYPDEATLEINGKSYPSNLGGYDVIINPGSNTVTIIVKGNSGRSRTYTVTVTRPSS